MFAPNKFNLKCVYLLIYSTLVSFHLTVAKIHISVTHPKVGIDYFYEKDFLLETSKYLEIKNGTKLQLRCQSDREVRWLFNRKEYDYVSSFETNVVPVEDAAKKYIIDLIMNSAEYNETGEYACVYNDEERIIEDFNSMSDRIYLFVNDEDHLVATKTLVEVPSKSEEYVLKCLPTNPRINVTLIKDSELMIIDNDTLKYHPTIGFIIKDSILDYKKSNLFNCVFKYENKTDELPFPFTISYVPLDNLSIRIDGDSENVVVNSTFSLTCELITQKVGQMKLYWSYPTANVAEPIKHSTFDYINDQMKYMNKITFVNVTKGNEGDYSCSASNTTMKNTKSLYIRVFDLNTTFTINVTTDLGNDAEIEIDYGIDVLMAYTINVWPTKGSDFKLACLKNGVLMANSVLNNQMIEMKIAEYADPRYNFTFENNQVIIAIKDADVHDSGVYTVTGQNTNAFANESITLVINGLPYIKLNFNDRFFELDKLYNIVFDIISFPLTNITFKRYLCSETDCDASKQENNWIELLSQEFYQQFNLTSKFNYSISNYDHNFTILSFERPKYYQIHLDLLANQSSIFKCEVNNNFGLSIAQLPTLVSDAGVEGFELAVLDDELIEDDNITLTCKATKFNYTELNWKWSFYDEEARTIELDKLIESGETLHSITSQLIILNAKQYESGDYKCLAEYKEEPDIVYEPNSKQVHLMIEKMVPPRILKTNMEKELKIIEVYQTTSINLYCEVTGRPKPHIVWKKNNFPINSSTTQSNGIEFVRDNQHLSIKRLVNDDSGKYECIVSNKGGTQNRVLGLKVKDRNDNSFPLTSLAGILTFVMIGGIFVGMAVFLGKRIREDRKQKQELEMFTQKLFNINQNIPFNPDLPLDEQIDLLPYDNKWEFPLDKLIFGPILGEGAFGRVIKAEAEGIDEFNYVTTVAVKMLKDDDMEQRKALMAELKILIHLGRHLNIVNLLGAVTVNAIKGELLVILEFCENGSLRQFLLNNRANFINQIDPETGEIDTNIHEKQDCNYQNEEVINSMNSIQKESDDCYLELTTGKLGRVSLKRSVTNVDPITSTDLICFCFQISRGMEYLESKKLIHRDLYIDRFKPTIIALRNVLLAKDNIVKICDFGLAKDCFRYDNYVKKNNGPLPVKWMAIESIADRVFTIKSDVWSFSILCWEMFTLGSSPYPGMEVDEEFYRKLKNGYRMEQPSYCPDSIYDLMKLCWIEDPGERLDFNEISKKLGFYLGENVTQHYIDLNLPFQDESTQMTYLENQGYLQIDSVMNRCDEEYLNVDLNEEAINYVNQSQIDEQLHGKLNSTNQLSSKPSDQVTILNPNNHIDHHAYANV